MLLIGDPFEIHVPIAISLAVIFTILAASIVASLQADKRDERKAALEPSDSQEAPS
jgi:hypothetical protein